MARIPDAAPGWYVIRFRQAILMILAENETYYLKLIDILFNQNLTPSYGSWL